MSTVKEGDIGQLLTEAAKVTKQLDSIMKYFWISASFVVGSLILFGISFWVLVQKGFSGELLLAVSGFVLACAGIFLAIDSIRYSLLGIRISMLIARASWFVEKKKRP